MRMADIHDTEASEVVFHCYQASTNFGGSKNPRYGLTPFSGLTIFSRDPGAR